MNHLLYFLFKILTIHCQNATNLGLSGLISVKNIQSLLSGTLTSTKETDNCLLVNLNLEFGINMD